MYVAKMSKRASMYIQLTCGVNIRGPDTNNRRRFVRSYARREQSRYPDKNPGWMVKLYKGPADMSQVPRFKGLKLLGKVNICLCILYVCIVSKDLSCWA